VLLKLLFGVVNELVGFVLDFNRLLGLFVLLFGSFSLLDHTVDISVGKTAGCLNLNVLVFPSSFIFGRDVHDTVGINVESYLNLGVATGSHWDTLEIKISKLLVVLSEFTLSLMHGDSNHGLVVSSGGESLTLFGGDCRVTGDESGENASHGLDTEGQGSNVEQQNVLNITCQHSTLNSSSNSNSLVGVDGAVGLLSEEVLNEIRHLRDTGGATDQEHLVNLVLSEAGVLEAVLEWLGSSINEVLQQTLEFGSGELQVQMLGAALVEGQEGNGDGGVGSR
jgi:hypothetical protein